MGQTITLTAADGFRLGAYRADPPGQPKGGLVVIQEIFGVNHHIRSVCDRAAAAGYVAVAPALFDRQQRNFQSGYTPDEVAQARQFIATPDFAAMLRDTEAALAVAKEAGPAGIVGFCLGGTLAFLAACRSKGLAAAVGFYGGGIVRFADEVPACPIELHFGATDANIPLADVETIRQKRPETAVHVYPQAGHGFHCDERASYHPASARQAWDRTLAFLAQHLKQA